MANHGALSAKVRFVPAKVARSSVKYHELKNMSAVKSKFAGILRRLLRYFEDQEKGTVNSNKTAAPVPAVPVVMSPPARARQTTRPKSAAAAPAAPSTSAPAPATPRTAAPAPTRVIEVQEAIELPLSPIIAGLPLELRAKVLTPAGSNGTIAVPVDKVLNQLATGSVRISFGELRQLAPQVFANYGGENDARAIALPLNQVLAQVNPAMLARRAAQKRVEVSDEVAGPFEAAAAAQKAAAEKAAAPVVPSPQPVPLSRLAGPVQVTGQQPPPVAPPPAFAPRWTAPPTQGGNRVNGGGNGPLEMAAKEGNGSKESPATRAGATITPSPSTTPKPNGPLKVPIESPLVVSLSALDEGWPEALKLEISQLDLENAQLTLPVSKIEPALKRGRVVFTWRDLRSWIKSAAVATSVHDDTELELPLKVLAPLFVARQNGSLHGPKKLSVAEEIPDMFHSGTPTASAPPVPSIPVPSVPPPVPPASVIPPMPSAVAAAIPPVDTNYFLRSIKPSASDSEFTRKGGTEFKSRGAAPADIVSRAMELPGVAGALITLADGLKVASQVPTELNGDTLAAFIPQIFARVHQGSRELRMGELNNLSFNVGGVQWKIFRVNAVYFAAFGRKMKNWRVRRWPP